VLITSFGRNVSPEWVETALRATPPCCRRWCSAMASPALSAVLWPARPRPPDAALQAAVDAANASLPDYARVQRWTRGRAAFERRHRPGHRQRPARSARAIAGLHADALEPGPNTPHRPVLTESLTHELSHPPARADRRRPPACWPRPIIQGALRGEVSLPSYLAFLREAYHHVRHTVPLLQATKARCPRTTPGCATPLDEYIEEEAGPRRVDPGRHPRLRRRRRRGAPRPPPGHATEVMVAYAYDTIARGNPLGFFGMVHVLEGTSVSLALLAADAIQKPLGCPTRPSATCARTARWTWSTRRTSHG
jgi:hypothetical protein